MQAPKLLCCSLLLVSAACDSTTGFVPDQGSADLPLPVEVMLAQAQTMTHCLAVDAQSVYWIDDGGGTARLMKVPIAGGTPQTLVSGGDVPGCAVLDGGNVYYTDTGALMMVPVTGGTPVPVVTGQNFLNRYLFPWKGYIHWITDVYGAVDAFNGKNAIVRARAGGAVEVLYAGLDGAGSLFVDDVNLYYADRTGTYARPRAGGTAVTFGSSAVHPTPFAVDSTHLAIVELQGGGAGALAAYRLDGMGRVQLAATVASTPTVDGASVYANQTGRLTRFAIDGSTSQVLAFAAPRAIAVDATSIYFTDGVSIQRVTK